METMQEKLKELAKQYFGNNEITDIVANFLTQKIYQLHEIYDEDCKIEDIKQELEDREIEYTDEDIDNILYKYEDYLGDSDDWHICLNEAIDDVFGGEL